MPPEDCLGLDQHDGLLTHWKQRGGKKKAKSVSQTQSWLAGTASEDIELVAEGGVLDDEFASRAAAEVGGNLERFNAGRKRSEG
jgi:hypothetical protein